MKQPENVKILNVFSNGGGVHYVMPHFQREYTWDKEQWRDLLIDILSIYDESEKNPKFTHFMGSLVVINDGTRNATLPVFKLVDGQQRLTTISLILAVLLRVVDSENVAIRKRISKMLTNEDELGDLKFKILPTVKYGDREIFKGVVTDSVVLDSGSKIKAAYDYFYAEIMRRVAVGALDPEKLFSVIIQNIEVVFINLNPEESPFKIFESLNAKGKPLTQADLVRNYIAMKIPTDEQEHVFVSQWSIIENLLQEKKNVGKSGLGELTAFLRHFLSMHNQSLCNERHVYARFRDRSESDFKTVDEFCKEIQNLKKFAEYYDKMLRPQKETNRAFREHYEKLNIFDVATAFPFMMAMRDSFERGELSQEQVDEALLLIENYIIRRYVCNEPTNFLNKMFPKLWSEIDQANFNYSLKNVLSLKKYPSDERVKDAMFVNSFYDGRSKEKIRYILFSINRKMSEGSGGYTVLDSNATIEHIMPQTLTSSWKNLLGKNAEKTYRDNLHLIGNLTLVTQEWNSSLSNLDFKTKKDKLAKHALKINNSYFSQDMHLWNHDAIRMRSVFLSEKFIECWPSFAPGVIESSTKMKPKLLAISSETFDVNSWREVMSTTLNFIIKRAESNINILLVEFPYVISKDRVKSYVFQLDNGWFMNTKLNSNQVKDSCRKIMDFMSMESEEWELIEEEVGIGLSELDHPSLDI